MIMQSPEAVEMAQKLALMMAESPLVLPSGDTDARFP